MRRRGRQEIDDERIGTDRALRDPSGTARRPGPDGPGFGFMVETRRDDRRDGLGATATGTGFSIGTPIRLPYSVHEPS